MKGFEFVLIGIGAILGAFVRYKIVESPLVLGGLPLNVLLVKGRIRYGYIDER